MIRTLVEIQGDRVSIERGDNGATVTVTVDSAQSDPGLLGAAAGQADRIQDLEGELASATRHADALEQELDRYRKAHVCTVECKPNQHTAFQGRQRVAELERDLAYWREQYTDREQARAQLEREMTEAIQVLERKVVEYDRDRTTERDRADQNKAWAERAEARLAKDAEVHVRKMAKVNGAVHSPDILSALKTPWHVRTEDQHSALAAAVRAVRQIIASPGPETSPA